MKDPHCEHPDPNAAIPNTSHNPTGGGSGSSTYASKYANPTDPAGVPTGSGGGETYCVGDPLDAGNGQFRQERALLNLPGLKVSLQYDAIWDSFSHYGRHWHMSADPILVVRRPKTPVGWPPSQPTKWIDLYQDGRRIVFMPSATTPGLFESSNGHFLKIRICEEGDCSYVLRTIDGTTMRFTETEETEIGDELLEVAWLRSVADPYGNATAIERHPSMRIDKIVNPSGQWAQLFYFDIDDFKAGKTLAQNVGKMKELRDNSGRVWSFQYDKFENLTKIVYPESEMILASNGPNDIDKPAPATTKALTTTLEYYQHSLTAVYEEADAPNASLRNVFGTNPNQPLTWGRVVEQTDARGNKWHFRYQDATPNQLAPWLVNLGETKLIVIEPDGRPEYSEINARGQILRRKVFDNVVDPATISQGGPWDTMMANWTLLAETVWGYDEAGHVSSIVFPEGNSAEYEYDLTSADLYKRANLMTARFQAGPRGGNGFGSPIADIVSQTRYEPIFGGVTHSTDPKGNITQLIYDYQEGENYGTLAQTIEDWDLDIDAASVQISFQNADLNGDGATDGLFGSLVLAKMPDATQYDPTKPGAPLIAQTGIEASYQYDATGLLTRIRKPEGNVTQLAYFDESDPFKNRLLRKTIADAQGIAATTEFDYDVLGRTIAISDPRGVVSKIEYTGLSQIARVTPAFFVDPEKAPAGLAAMPEVSTRLYYDADGNLVRSEGKRLDLNAAGAPAPHDVIAVQRFDALGNVTEKLRQVSHAPLSWTSTRYEYDARNRLVKIKSPLAVSGAEPTNIVSFFHDGLGRVCQTVRGLGSEKAIVTTAVYDRNGNLVAAYDAASNGVGNPDNIAGCGGFEATGEKTTIVYDGFDRPVGAIDALGQYTATTYDSNSNALTRTVVGRVDGPASAMATLHASRAEFDALDRLIKSEAAYAIAGATPGSLLEDKDQDGWTRSLVYYDRNSRPLIRQNDNGNNIYLVYDGMDRVQAMVDAIGNTRSMQYDAAGNATLVTQIDVATDGAASVEYRVAALYNALGYTTKTLDSFGLAQYRLPDYSGRTLLAADANGPMGGTALPGILVSASSINKEGNVVAARYDDLGRPVQIDRYLTASGKGSGAMPPSSFTQIISTKKVFDANGRLLAEVDPKNNAQTYTYDSINRLITARNADSTTRSFTYDLDGNVETITQEDGTKLKYSYDALNRPVALTTLAVAPDVIPVTQAMRYDGLNRLTYGLDSAPLGPLGDVEIALQRQYDSLGNLREETSSTNGGSVLGVVRNSFDGVGNRTELVYPDGMSLQYGYDAAERMKTIARAGATLASYEYIGQRVARRNVFTNQGANLGMTPHYDEALRLTRLNYTVNGGQIADYRSVLDRAGNRLNEVRADAMPGTQGDVFRYDSLYRLVQFLREVPNADAEVWSPGTGGAAEEAVNYSLDPAGNRLTVTDGAGTHNYQHNEMNELIKVDGKTYKYDERGNLVEVK